MKISIGFKIMLGFALVLLVVCVIGLASYQSTLKFIETSDWVTHSHRVIENVESAILQLTKAETGQRGYLLTGREEYLEPYVQSEDEIVPEMEQLRALTSDNLTQQRRIEAMIPLIVQRMAVIKQTIDARREKGFEAALALVLTDQGQKLMEQLRALAHDVKSEELKLLEERTAESDRSARTTTYTILAGTITAFVLVALVAFCIQRLISRPLSAFVDFVEKVGNGDLTQKTEVRSSDEVGQLGTSINQMVAALNDMAGQTLDVTTNLNAAAAEILASTQQQAAGTKEQAATIQQITSTMEEVRLSGTQISEKASQVAAVAEAASTSSSSGLTAVQDANRMMEAIREQVEEVAENIVTLSEKTQAVGEIIATVNDIAERSNLLALNASIEAAAAGDQGNRFSVVANEMKNLADQAKDSTVQVRSILGDIQKGITSSVMLTEEAVKRVESGKMQAELTQQVIRQLADSTQESVQTFQQIIGVTNQQQIGFEQVTKGMQDIRQTAVQTAAGTLQLEKAASNLNAQSQQLRTAVGRYHL